MSYHETQDRSLLIADEDEIFARVAARALARRGFQVTQTNDASSAFEVIASRPPAYALIDLRFRNCNGLDIVEALRNARPDARAVILTAYGDLSTAVSAAKLGVVDYLAKPSDAAAIAAALRGEARKFVRNEEQWRPEEQELRYLLSVFEQQDRNMSRTARLISKHRRSLQRILRRYGIKEDQKLEVQAASPFGRTRRLMRFWKAILEGELRYGEQVIEFKNKPVTEAPRDRRRHLEKSFGQEPQPL